jgi:hypothetical protein
VIESILYLIQSVSGYVEATEDTYIPAILAMFPKIPSHHLVSQTALLMIGKYMLPIITLLMIIYTKNLSVLNISSFQCQYKSYHCQFVSIGCRNIEPLCSIISLDNFELNFQ